MSETIPLLLRDVEAAQLLNVSVSWLRADRRTKQLVPFRKISGLVRYSPAELQRFAAGEPLARKPQ